MTTLLLLFCLILTASIRCSYSSNFKDVLQNLPLTEKEEKGDICISKECKDAGAHLLTIMNKSVDPCTNFHEFVCGNFAKQYNYLSIYTPYYTMRNTIYFKIEEIRKSILNEEISPDDSRPLQKEKMWYKSCLNRDALVENFALARTINEAAFPLIINGNETEYSWQNVEAYYANLTGESFLFTIKREPTDMHNDVFELDVPRIHISHMPSMIIHALLDQAEVINKILYKDIKRNDIIPELFQAANFADALQRIVNESQDHENKVLTNITISQFQEFYDNSIDINECKSAGSKVDWLKLLQMFFSDMNYTITDSFRLNIKQSSYFSRLSRLLCNTFSDVIINFMHFSHMRSSFTFTYETSDEAYDRWALCSAVDVSRLLKDGSSYEFISRYISPEHFKLADNMMENVRKEFIKDINSCQWLDNETKRIGTDKLLKMDLNIGYRKRYLNFTSFNEFLDDLHFGYSSYENNMNALLFFKRKRFDTKDVAEIYGDNYTPTDVNAGYFNEKNLIVIFAGELYFQVFNPALPDAMNYGSLGFTIGHEMFHGFHADGIQYFDNGYRVREPVWPKQMQVMFRNKAQCISDYYKQFPNNGNKTLHEDLADIYGTLLAFNTFKKNSANKNYLKLPGLEDLSADQLFFVSLASTQCSNDDVRTVNKDEHSHYLYRIKGITDNIKGFVEAFNCKNKPNACPLW